MPEPESSIENEITLMLAFYKVNLTNPVEVNFTALFKKLRIIYLSLR